MRLEEVVTTLRGDGIELKDLDNGLVHVGTAAGVFYAVQVPLP